MKRTWRMSADVDTSTNNPQFYVWPEADTSYMKMIWKHPTKKYPSGFHILGTRYHPVGDFDRPDIKLPSESLRIYETQHGFRVFFTGRFNVDRDSMFDELDSLGGDPLYSKFARARKYFACRVGPKELPCPQPYSITRLVEQTGEPLPEWGEFIQYHDQLTNALAQRTFLV